MKPCPVLAVVHSIPYGSTCCCDLAIPSPTTFMTAMPPRRPTSAAAQAPSTHSFWLSECTATTDAPSFLQFGQIVSSLAGAVYCHRGVLSTLIHTYSRTKLDGIYATYGRHLDRAMRMQTAAFHELVGIEKQQLPRSGVPAEVREREREKRTVTGMLLVMACGSLVFIRLTAHMQLCVYVQF